MPGNELEQLREQIPEAFPPARFHGSITTCDCEECLDLRKALSGQRWDEVPTAFLDFTCSPALLDAEAFQAFLPAYMLRGLDDLKRERVVLEFTVYSLCPELHPRQMDYPDATCRVDDPRSGPSDQKLLALRRLPRRGR